MTNRRSHICRPETAQGIFINFKNVLDTSRRKLPFGIAQIGKAFRNEVTPGNFIFRTREFEQMEMEYFCRAEDAPQLHQEWIDGFQAWLGSLGISPAKISALRADSRGTGSLRRTNGRYNVPLFPRTRGRGQSNGTS